jgi:hypothetical protein
VAASTKFSVPLKTESPPALTALLADWSVMDPATSPEPTWLLAWATPEIPRDAPARAM